MKIFKDWRQVGYCPNCECVMCNQQTIELRMFTEKIAIKLLKKKGDCE